MNEQMKVMLEKLGVDLATLNSSVYTGLWSYNEDTEELVCETKSIEMQRIDEDDYEEWDLLTFETYKMIDGEVVQIDVEYV